MRLLAGAILLLVSCPAIAAEPTIEWKVVDRFPIVSDFPRIESDWERAESSDMVDFIRKRLAAKQDNSANGLARTDFLISDPRKAPPVRSLFVAPRPSQAVVAWVMHPEGPCDWSTYMAPFVGNPNGCKVELQVPHGSSAAIAVEVNGRKLEAKIEPKELIVAVLGDSYSSGEGSPDRPAIYPKGMATPKSNDWFMRPLNAKTFEPAVWWDSPCHRSFASWPVMAALRLALTEPHYTVKLVDVACSGAEFLDGFFVAQMRGVVERDVAKLRKQRDGLENPRKSGKSTPIYLARSQVNELRDALCEPEVGYDQIQGVQDGLETVVWRRCTKPLAKPDVLLLTAGGNDVFFSSAVKGVLMPNKTITGLPHSVMTLNLMRHLANATSPDLLKDKAEFFTKEGAYRKLFEASLAGALVTPAKTVLVRYPNPVGRPEQIGSRMEVDCWNHGQPKRLSESFMSFGPVARQMVPWPLKSKVNWVIDLNRDEVKTFSESAFPAVQTMLRQVPQGVVSVDWQAARPDLYADRLLCSNVPQERMALEANFFCSGSECTAKPSLDDWKFEAPDRLLINTSNDAMLGLRTWVGAPTKTDLLTAAGGAFHPNAEAHALAADSAFQGICKVLRPSFAVCKGLPE